MENGVRFASVWRGLSGVERAVVEEVEFDAEAGVLVAHVRPGKGARQRCGRCGRRAARYDRGDGRRRWRGLDLGVVRAVLEADAPRVDCPQHGPTVAAVPWARHGAGHTYAFDDQVAWLAVHTSRTAVAALMRVAWRTVGAICARVARDGQQAGDRLAGLRRIGIDELSYKRGHRYITCVVDHDTARLVWAWPGRDKANLNWIARTHPRLHRAWALKEGLRWVFTLARAGFRRLAIRALDRWLCWARRCRIPAFVDLAARVTTHRQAIEVGIEHRLSNALVESVNTKLRLITRIAFGFHDPHALIGLAMLALGGLCPPLPGRASVA